MKQALKESEFGGLTFEHLILYNANVQVQASLKEVKNVFEPFRPIGQEVKTPPFHGGIGGSIPPWVTKKMPWRRQ